MNKDIKNVVITFSLVATIVFGDFILYSREVSAQQLIQKQTEEYEQKQIIAEQAMQLLLITKSIELEHQISEENAKRNIEAQAKIENQKQAQAKVVTIAKDITPKADTPAPTPRESNTPTPAQIEAQAKLEAEALAKQIADEKLAAKKQAATQAQATAVKNSRRSTAS